MSVPELSLSALHDAMAALAPVARLAAAGGLRALPAEPRDGQTGGGDPQAFVDRMHDRGDAARARRAWSRLQRVPPALQVTLLWLADRGDARPTVREASLLYARERAPISLRDAADHARAAREKAEREFTNATKAHAAAIKKNRRLITEEVALLRNLVANLRNLVPQRQREEEAAAANLVAWGRTHLALACSAWAATARGDDFCKRSA